LKELVGEKENSSRNHQKATTSPTIGKTHDAGSDPIRKGKSKSSMRVWGYFLEQNIAS